VTPWEPRAPLERLRFVASLRAVIRAWMSAENVLEVTTPVLSRAAPADLHLDAFRTAPLPSTPTDDGPSTDGSRWLQTSPEYPMKRLLAAHGVDIHQIAPVFRAGERGARHNPEFTMLEWYRIGMDHNALMDDVAALFETLWRRFDRPWHSPERHGVHDLVNEVLGAGAAATDRGPFLDVVQVRAHFLAEGRSWPASIGDDADAALDLLLDEFVLPRLPRDRLTFLHGWPPSQAALARLGTDAAGRDVAERFEVYMGALEIGNGITSSPTRTSSARVSSRNSPAGVQADARRHRSTRACSVRSPRVSRTARASPSASIDWRWRSPTSRTSTS